MSPENKLKAKQILKKIVKNSKKSIEAARSIKLNPTLDDAYFKALQNDLVEPFPTQK